MSVRPLARPRRCDPPHGRAVRLRFRVVHGPQRWVQRKSPRLTRTSMREGRERRRRQPVVREAPLLHFHENIDRAVIAFNQEGHITLFNPAAEELMQRSSRQATGQSYRELFKDQETDWYRYDPNP